jgi:hypothetical protein
LQKLGKERHLRRRVARVAAGESKMRPMAMVT